MYISNDLEFQVALKTASASSREAPWYGIYNWILSHAVFPGIIPEDVSWPTTTVTYPQYPLTTDIDTDMHEEYDEDDDDNDSDARTSLMRSSSYAEESPMDISSDPAAGYIDIDVFSSPLSSPSPVSPLHMRQGMAPSPESGTNSSPPSKSDANRRTKRSTRIPDFVQFLHVKQQEKVVSHLLLIVEIKKEGQFQGRYSYFDAVMKQITSQALHAFANSEVDIIGAIAAVGPNWKYVEYHRSQILQPDTLPDLRSMSQRTYAPSSSPEGSMSSIAVVPMYRLYQPFEDACLPTFSYCVLDSSESDAAWEVLRTRMIQIAKQHYR
ncbi:hypothetical protein H0H92_006826 [Tricholoma furcatifolium]|nr:hypothetical protein H0H92_006826 [Tricholoma furcatifolium]